MIAGRPWVARVEPPTWDRTRTTAEYAAADLRRLGEPGDDEGLVPTQVTFADGRLTVVGRGPDGHHVHLAQTADGLAAQASEGGRMTARRAADASALAAAEPVWFARNVDPLLRALADGGDPLRPRAADRPATQPAEADRARLAGLVPRLADPPTRPSAPRPRPNSAPRGRPSSTPPAPGSPPIPRCRPRPAAACGPTSAATPCAATTPRRRRASEHARP